MVHPSKYFILFFLLTLFGSSTALAGEKCECPKVSCQPCQRKVTLSKKLKFCSWGEISVCKTQVCENNSNYFQCISDYQKKLVQKSKKGQEKKKDSQKKSTTKSNASKNDPNKQSSEEPSDKPVENLVLMYNQVKKRKKAKRAPSSVRSLITKEVDRPIDFSPPGLIPMEDENRNSMGEQFSDNKIAKLKSAAPGIEMIHRNTIFSPKTNEKIYENDEIINNGTNRAKVSIQYSEGVVSIFLEPKTKFTFLNSNGLLGRFRPFLHLKHGKVFIDNPAKGQRLDILAGQMITQFEQSQGMVWYYLNDRKLKAKVELYSGSAKVFRSANLAETGVKLKEGQTISWFTDQPEKVSEDPNTLTFKNAGILTPIFPIRKSLLLRLPFERNQKVDNQPQDKVQTVEFAPWTRNQSRSIASFSEEQGSLCQSPSGALNSCMWTCEGNTAGRGECQAGAPKTFCVRRTCDANGHWALPTSFGEKYKDLCPAQGERVGRCEP